MGLISSLSILKTKHFNTINYLLAIQRFSQDISSHGQSRYMIRGDFLELHRLSEAMVYGINVFHSPLVFWIPCSSYCTLIVHCKRTRLWHLITHICQYMTEESHLP